MICRNKKCAKEILEGSLYCNWCGWKQVSEPRSTKRRGNGEGSIYRLSNGKYRAEVVLGYYNVVDENGKSHLRKKKKTRSFSRPKDAAAAIPELIKQAEGYKVTHDETVYNLHEIFLNSQKYKKLSPGHQDKLKYAWDRLKPIWHRKITDVSVLDLQDVVDKLNLTYYPAKDMKVLISHMYQTAMKLDIMAHNKSECIELPEAPKAKKQVFTQEEKQALWNDYEGRDKEGNVNKENAHEFTGYILIMIYVGLRYGELAKLSKDDIFLNEQYMIGGIKTEAGTDRVLAIPDKVLPIVRRMYFKNKRKLLEMNEDNFYDQYWETLERAEIRALPPQTCRHTYFSDMSAAGVSPAIIAAAGGHADYDTTYKNYVNIPLTELLNAVNKI